MLARNVIGGNNRARTYDPLLVRQMLSQLSYASISIAFCSLALRRLRLYHKSSYLSIPFLKFFQKIFQSGFALFFAVFSQPIACVLYHSFFQIASLFLTFFQKYLNL